MKPYTILLCCFALILLICTPFLSADDGPKELVLPSGTMTLKAPENSERAPRLSPVVFPHSLHFQYSCKECHHEWDGKTEVKSCATAGCHESLWAAAPGTVPKGETPIKSLTGAYHKTCRGCHRNELAAQKAAGVKMPVSGPIACEECHPTPHSPVENALETLMIPVGDLTISAPEDVEAKRSSVTFPHGRHFGLSCMTCHHEWDGESEIESCTSCHDELEPDPSSRDIRNPDNAMYFLAAYHNICMGCHRDGIKANRNTATDMPPTGPIACNGCHTE